ncbi:MAG: class I SAM-dependent methyltransferase [Chloroflexota bacterium]
MSNAPFIPALRYHFLTPLFDPAMRWIMREERFKRPLLDQAKIQPGQTILDLGCGTGTLTIQAKRHQPEAEVFGLDIDPRILQRARLKAQAVRVAITFDQGAADLMPYPDQFFDRILSSLVIHHLTTSQKQQAMNELYRVLRPGGELHLVDFGRPRSLYARLLGWFIASQEEAADNIQGLLPGMMEQAGLHDVVETNQFTTILGGLSLYRARKPE